MREKLKIVISVFIILICSTACGKERIEYISTTTQEKAVESTESNSYQVYENVETATDGDYDIIASEELVPVHVCGAVNNPGLYYMKADSLKADALALAGGFAPDAAIDYINLAEMITYGEKIYFPYVDELQAGYNLNDFDQILNEFDKIIGLDKLLVLHINDSKNELGQAKDRHENFGYGKIGFENLINVIYHEKLKDVPKILETPYVDTEIGKLAPYKMEINMIKNKKFNDNLVNDIVLDNK